MIPTANHVVLRKAKAGFDRQPQSLANAPAMRLEEHPMARPTGLEPVTDCLEGSCSIQLSYGRPKEKIIIQTTENSATKYCNCLTPS